MSGQPKEDSTEKLRAILKSQYHATLKMLRQAIEEIPDNVWLSKEHENACWQLAYHTLFFAHLYSQQNEAAFHPWEHEQSEVQNRDAIPNERDPNSKLPLLPKPYTKEEILAYWNFCDEMI